MANLQQRIEAELNAAVARASDGGKRANLELVREYLLNGEFRANLHDFTFANTYRRAA